MPERKIQHLCPGVTEEHLRIRLVRAIRYWSNLDTTLLPDLSQIQWLHRKMFHGCLRGTVAGRLKRKANMMGRSVHPSSPAYVKKDYAILTENAQKLLSLISPPPPPKPDPHDASQWPAADDHQQWMLRALYVAYFHVHLIHIHPFDDGNGRVTRLVAWEQARRLFPCVCSDHYGPEEEANKVVDDQRVRQVDQKANHYLFPGRDTMAAAEYLDAMVGFNRLNINYVPIVRYFMFEGDRRQLPTVLDQPHFKIHHHTGQLHPNGTPNLFGTRPPENESGDMDPEPPYEDPCPPLERLGEEEKADGTVP